MSNSPVPFFRATITEPAIDAVVETMRSGWLTSGKQANAFEAEFAEHIGGDVKAIAVKSATAGLHLALEALGVRPGDEVIVPTLTFTASAEVVDYLGAKVVLVDIDPGTLCADFDSIKAAVTDATSAVIFVHFGGYPADLNKLHHFCSQNDIKLIEDAAHATPTFVQGNHVGAVHSDAAVFSFYANKTITTGEGGMIVTHDENVAGRCRLMRTHGIDRDAFARFTGASNQWQYDVVEAGYKYNMTDVAAALGRVQLRDAQNFCDSRTNAAALYDDLLGQLNIGLPPKAPEDCQHSWHLYPILLPSAEDRDRVTSAFHDAEIGYSVHYTPLHELTYWGNQAIIPEQGLPNADRYFSRCISLPLFPSIQKAEQERVVDVLARSLHE
jgi:dTDP-4-amino-4,6-dideoxygalactose transaminase